MKSGIIQGSVIGPRLFVGFINDLPSEVVTYHLELFADDSKAIALVRDAIDRRNVQIDLYICIEKWSQENHLPLCTEKSACLHYVHENPKYSYAVNGDIIKSMLESVDLGVIRSANFNNRQHIDKICLRLQDYLLCHPEYVFHMTKQY